MANILQRTKYWFTGNPRALASGPAPAPRSRKVSPFLWPGYVDGQPQWQITDYRAYVNEGFNLNTLIYSSIMYKARALTAAPLRAYEGDQDNPEPLPPDDPLSKLVSRPNPHQSMVEFRQQQTVYINISGDNYIYFYRPQINGTPETLYNLRPDRVLILPGKENGQSTIRGYVYVPEGKSAFSSASPQTRIQMRNEGRALYIVPQDIMHTKFPNPGDPLEGMGYGLSPISPLAQSADVDNSITHFLKLFFDHGVMLPGALSTDQPLDPKIVGEIKERWKETYGGYYNWAEEIGVLERGTTYQRIGLNFEEMGFQQQDERNESRILGPFGVPPILIGTRIGLNRSTYSNYKQARQAFWEDTMVPESGLFEVDYQYHLNDGSKFVGFDYSKVPAFQELRQQNQDRMIEAGKSGYAKRSEVRRSLGLTVDEAEDDVYVISPMLVEVPAESGNTGTEGDGAEAGDDSRKALPGPRRAKALAPDQKARAAARLDKAAEVSEDDYADASEDALEEDRRAVLARANVVKQVSLRRKQTIDWEAIQRSWKDYFENDAPENWRELFFPLLIGTTTEANDIWTAELGIQFDVQNLLESAALQYQVYGMTFSEPILETTEADLFALLKTAAEGGWTIEQLNGGIDTLWQQYLDPAAELTDIQRQWFVNRSPQYRIENIARTESMHSANFASTSLFRAYGAEYHEWLATIDGRQRPTHEAANGQVVVIGQPFKVGTSMMLYPLDGSRGAPAEEICQCRCVTAPVFREEE